MSRSAFRSCELQLGFSLLPEPALGSRWQESFARSGFCCLHKDAQDGWRGSPLKVRAACWEVLPSTCQLCLRGFVLYLPGLKVSERAGPDERQTCRGFILPRAEAVKIASPVSVLLLSLPCSPSDPRGLAGCWDVAAFGRVVTNCCCCALVLFALCRKNLGRAAFASRLQMLRKMENNLPG